ncbi:MAG TPA: 30S ribosomal protein S20 [Chloroflexota bacterium]|nr:30S ribosomal protein S20 [Chloroflexota bacterium]
MANKRSALKAHRVSERKRLRNRSVRSAVRTFVKNARAGLASGSAEEATTAVAKAAQELDKAAGKGVIHRNQAARRKSRLMHRLAVANKLAAERTVVEEAAPRPRRARATTTRAATPRAPRASRAEPKPAE